MICVMTTNHICLKLINHYNTTSYPQRLKRISLSTLVIARSYNL